MAPRLRIAGMAGILSGLLLVGELTLFMTAGWTPEAFADPVSAFALLEEGGAHLRGAVVLGGLNLAALTLFFAGLAGRLYHDAPTRASAALYLGLIGIAGHALVPLAFWVGIPALLELRALDPAASHGAWGGFHVLLEGAQAVGSLFLGLAMTAVGWAIVASKAWPKAPGWVAIGAGLATLLTLFAAGTPFAGLGRAAFMPALLLSVVFRIWAGITLHRSADNGLRTPAPVIRPAGQG